MLDVKKIRTRHETNMMKSPKGKNFIIALDIGYSATKVFCENGYMCFPSYAKKLNKGKMLNITNDKDILYMEDGSDDIYIVGYMAQEMVESSNTNDSDAELFSRKRYKDKRFGIVCATGIALALKTRESNDGRNVFIQTGLPASYKDEDTPAMKSALSREMKFKLKVGAEPWKEFHFQIDKGNIHVIPQPMGSLYSTIITNEGEYSDDAWDILPGNVIVLDAGFGTFDFYGFHNREVSCQESTDELGMKQLLVRASKKIFDETGVDIRTAAMQKCLTNGTFKYINEDEMVSENRPIDPYIKEANEEMIEELKGKVKSVTNAFADYDYIVIAGGTGEAWLPEIRAWLHGMGTITMIESNRNDGLPFIYSNVRGYYLYRYAMDH